MTHIAAQAVTIEGRYMRQRCAWCGLVLLDYDLATIASMDGAPPAEWEQGAQVAIEGNGSWLVPGQALEPTSCALMEVTR